MSINMENGAAEYADHEVQVIGVDFIDAETGGETEVLEQFNPVSSRGLDSDELAELVGVYRTVSAEIRQTSGGGIDENPGTASYECELGINLTNSEFPGQSFNNSPTAETVVDGSPISDGTGRKVRKVNYDEPGVLDTAYLNSVAPFRNPADGTGGGGDNEQGSERMIDFRSLLGTGPFVDKTDDIVIHAEGNYQSLEALSFLNANYVLYWDVQEMPEGRASFSRP
jgi:hypothetical protein